MHQSLDGSEHYIIDRAPQGQPRVLHQNTNRNIGDIITPIAVVPTTPTPAAILPTPGGGAATAVRHPKQEPPEAVDIKPSLLGLPEGISVTPASTSALPPITTAALQLPLAAAHADMAAAAVTAATHQTIPLPVNMVWANAGGMVTQENNSAVNNVPLRIVGKM